MNLFQLGDYTLSSGLKSKWKIECDALTDEDIAALATMALEILPVFSLAVGVPRGGTRLANAINELAYPEGQNSRAGPVLIVEDVLTTGRSMENVREICGPLTHELGAIGLVIFARGKCPDWVTALFQMPG